MRWWPVVFCLVIFHAPDGQQIIVESAHISLMRSTEGLKEHLAPGTNTILNVGAHKIGIAEKLEEAEAKVDECQDSK